VPKFQEISTWNSSILHQAGKQTAIHHPSFFLADSVETPAWGSISSFLRALNRLFPQSLECPDPDIPLLKQAKAEYAKLQ
jgi:hypothetical protein